MSRNEEAKQRAARLLKDGAMFAFGLSERQHGADIYSTEMTLTPSPTGATGPTERSTTSATATSRRWSRPSGRWRTPGITCSSRPTRRSPTIELLDNVVATQALRLGVRPARLPGQRGDILSKGGRPGTPPSTPSTSASSTWARRPSASARTPSTRRSTTPPTAVSTTCTSPISRMSSRCSPTPTPAW